MTADTDTADLASSAMRRPARARPGASAHARPRARARGAHERGRRHAVGATLAGAIAGLAIGAVGVVGAPTVDAGGEDAPDVPARMAVAERLSWRPSGAVADVLVPAANAFSLARSEAVRP